MLEFWMLFLIIAIVAAASAPMISKKMINSAAQNSSPWVWTGTDNAIAFNIAENNTFNKREGTITIHSGRLSETVTIYQKNSDDAILLSQNEYIVSSTGEDIAVEVTSNVDVEIEMPDVDWIKCTTDNTYCQ